MSIFEKHNPFILASAFYSTELKKWCLDDGMVTVWHDSLFECGALFLKQLTQLCGTRRVTDYTK